MTNYVADIAARAPANSGGPAVFAASHTQTPDGPAASDGAASSGAVSERTGSLLKGLQQTDLYQRAAQTDKEIVEFVLSIFASLLKIAEVL